MAESLRRPKVPIHVLIVTADNMTGELLTSAFSRVRKDFEFATIVGSSQDAIGELNSHAPHVALICAELQDGPQAGFKVLQSMRTSRFHTAAIMLLQSSSPHNAVGAFREGARGVFYRNHSLKALSKCIRTVYGGQIWASNEDIEHILGALVNLTPARFNGENGEPMLTHREEDVVRLVTEGLKNREIAQKLGVAEHTIRNYLCRIFEKLGVSTRVELMRQAFSEREPEQSPASRMASR
jgi:two-component system nitrate/nitrite response regulator NarL